MLRLFCLLVPCLLFGFPGIARAQSDPIITEILAINSAGITDGTGAHSDWIEIHNPGATTVVLTGWHLTDDAEDLIRYTFPPGFTIPPNGYRIVFASGNPNPPPGQWHTGFSLDGDGEYLALVKPDGITITSDFSLAFPKQRKDISYGSGLNVDDPQRFFFTSPTPGAANGAGGLFGFVGDTQFSVKRGFYDAPFDLEISASEAGSTIRYTLDGSVPTLTEGMTYSGPIAITTTTVVRAAAFKAGYLPTNVDTHTYVFIANVLQQPANIPGWPNPTYSLGSGTAVHDYQMDPAVVTAPAYSSMIDPAMRAIPTMSIVLPQGDIFGAAGFYDTNDIEKPTSIEVLYADRPLANEHAAGGVEGHSHIRMKRSLRLNFRSELGDSTFKTDLFKRMPWNPPGVSTHDRLILRAGNNRAWSRSFSKEKTTYCIDELARQTQLALSGYGMRGAFVHLYINGLYWGLFNVTERADTHFTSRYFGGENDDWVAINHGGVLDGDPARYNYLIGSLKNKDLAVAGNYAEFQEYLDTDGFIDYLLVHWYPATGDWPTNNWYAGHRLPTSPLGATPLRYFAWDGEWSWDLPHASAPNPPPYNPWVHSDFRAARTKTQGAPMAQLFNSAKHNALFKRTLADRVYKHYFNGGPLSDAAMQARFTQITNYVRDAIVGESARWGDTLKLTGQPTFTRDLHWQNEVNVILGLINGRAARFITALRAEDYYPSIDPPTFSQRGGPVASGFSLTLANPNASGSIRYTLDGTDPVDAGGLTYSGAIVVNQSVRIRARVLSGLIWSAQDEAIFHVPAPAALRITEIMYHPAPPTPAEIAAGFADQDDFEFIELHNRGPVALQLEGMRFTHGITFTFPPHLLEAGARVLVVSNPAAFAFRYGSGATVIGTFGASRLANDGERIRLVSPLDETIADFIYRDAAPWASEADGDGQSLVFIDAAPGTDPALAGNWRASAAAGGSPGRADTLSFTEWARAWLPGRPAVDLDPYADPEGDGVINLIEFGLGLNPLASDAQQLPVARRIEGNLAMDYARDLFKSNLTITAEYSATLAPDSWSSAGITDTTLSTVSERQSRRATVAITTNSSVYLRLRVTLSPE